jgi:hypothetical protein
MQRALAIALGLGLVVVLGCRDYDFRLQETLGEMKYRKRLNDNLAEPPTNKTALHADNVYVRPPKSLSVLAQTFGLTVDEGKFDIQNSFIDQAKGASLHMLVRHKKPKAATNKKTAKPAAEAVLRGDFTSDVLEVVKNAYGVDVQAGSLKAETKVHKGRKNTFRVTRIDLTAKEVQIYLYGNKNDPYEVALIFEGPKDEIKNLGSKINLCLESFAVGPVAQRAYAGATDFEGGDDGESLGPVPL